MAPQGTKCYIHIKPHKRASWRFHAEDTWCVRPAMKHYRCYAVVMKQTSAQWITDTIHFKRHNRTVPTVKPAEKIEKAVKELTKAVHNNLMEKPTDYIEAVQQLRAVLLEEKQQQQTESIPKKMAPPKHNQIPEAQQPAKTKATPCNGILTYSLVLIPCEEDKLEPKKPTQEE
eukprot:7268629-Ditylum_brightwellii.AAC.1